MSITNPKGKNSIYAENLALRLNKVNIENVYAGTSDGAALICIECLSSNITSSVFRNLAGLYGGALYFSDIITNKNTHLISQSTFTNMTSLIGGTLFTKDIYSMSIQASSFSQSNAYSMAGDD